MTSKYIKMCVVLGCLFSLNGCGGHLNRLQGSMDQMTYYMGMMAASMPQLSHSTSRLANSTERIEGKTDRLVSDFQKKGVSAERSIQNYTQAFIDNDKAIAKNLQNIKEEISGFRQGQSLPTARADSPDQAKINASINDRISRLEAQIAALSSKLK